ncbi:DUF4160 domain-containing protein [Altererythrobacter soli]|uniref:DUF4160 domain-containing protein n=1 Tax=Croceibacterium soli TaxID=1739690 RepID=A0A6I4UUQ9_9SPHN|nr:DUF4160 domain-containing protein [Croceibacterium soli]MXP42266.1 DUF4160 domain-containing protein [Croceibacterium soli]
MPTILRIEGYRFYFYSHEPYEPPHVHVDRGEGTAKVWLEALSLARSSGLKPKEIGRILELVREHRAMLLEAWHGYFGGSR